MEINENARIRTGSGSVVHSGVAAGRSVESLDCGSDRYRNGRSSFVVLPSDTAVTCRKCNGGAVVPVVVAEPVVASFCSEGHKMSKGACFICD